jgi:lysophospholipase L1-like esterase
MSPSKLLACALLWCCAFAHAQANLAAHPYATFSPPCGEGGSLPDPRLTPVVDEAASTQAGAGAVKTQKTPVYRGVPRIGVWGDSHTASGEFVDAMMDAWGFPAANVRPSLIEPALGQAGVRLPFAKTCMSGGWKLSFAHRASARHTVFSQTFTLLSSDTPGEVLGIDFRRPGSGRLKWVNIHYRKADANRALILGISINGAPESLLNLSSPGQAFQVQANGFLATLRLRLVAGQISINAFEPVYDTTPAAFVDVFSVPGAVAKGWSWPALEASASPDYDMVIFQYGTNEAMEEPFDAVGYARTLRQDVGRFRATHSRSQCVLIGPPDRGSTTGNPNKSYSAIHYVINQIQGRVSHEFHCEFWNWQAAMGSRESIRRWFQATPALAQKDLTHLTAKGYQLSARIFADAIKLEGVQRH